jgi:hypothetical protein
MRQRPVKEFAANAARTVGRRVRARSRGHVEPAPAPPPRSIKLPQARSADAEAPGADAQPAADDAQLDALRGALVRELDRLAADDDCSASFRRA